MNVTIPVTIKSEIAKIICNLLFLSIGNLKAIFFATGPTITVSKKKATINPGINPTANFVKFFLRNFAPE